MLILSQLKCKDIIKEESEQKQGENWGTMREVTGILSVFHQSYEQETVYPISTTIWILTLIYWR